MSVTTRSCRWIVAAILLWSVAPAGAQQNQTPPRAERSAGAQDAAQLRALADQASRRAADWDALAKAARETAAKTTDPVIKKSWEDGARQHEARAKEQRDEAARLAAQVTEKTATGQQGGAAPSPDPGAKTASPPASPPGAPPIATGTAAQPAPGPASAAAAGACPAGPASDDTALPIDAIAGSWRSDDGKEVVEIAPKSPSIRRNSSCAAASSSGRGPTTAPG